MLGGSLIKMFKSAILIHFSFQEDPLKMELSKIEGLNLHTYLNSSPSFIESNCVSQ